MAQPSILSRIAQSSALTTTTTTALLALLSWKETKHPAAAINATSHIAWGDEAARIDDADFEHTFVGAALNAGAMFAWSAVHAALPRARSPLAAVRNGALIAGLAYATDYYVVPKRLTPGFEQRLSKFGLFATYATLAASLAVSSLLGDVRS